MRRWLLKVHSHPHLVKSGWYASYWNSFLFHTFIRHNIFSPHNHEKMSTQRIVELFSPHAKFHRTASVNVPALQPIILYRGGGVIVQGMSVQGLSVQGVSVQSNRGVSVQEVGKTSAACILLDFILV